MKIHHYHPKTKEYLGEGLADKDPMVEDNWLIPANATTVEPLIKKDGFAIVLNNTKTAWEYVEDSRGKIVYNTTTKQSEKVDYLGEIESGWTLLEPTSQFDEWINDEWVKDIEAACNYDLSVCKKELASKRWEVSSDGVLIDGVNVQSDKESKDEMAGYVTESIVNGLVNVNWKLSDGTFKVYTIQKFKEVYKIVAKYRNDCFGAEMDKLEQIHTAEDPTTVDIDSGWPNNVFTTN